MDKSFDLTPLVDSLSNSFARRLGLNRRGFIHLLQACHFEEGMLQFQGRRTQCDQLLELCRPVLDQLCQEPEEGWLRFCYETLAWPGLFPDPSRPPPTAKQREAMEFYLQILEWLLAREQSFCPFDPLLDPHWASPRGAGRQPPKPGICRLSQGGPPGPLSHPPAALAGTACPLIRPVIPSG